MEIIKNLLTPNKYSRPQVKIQRIKGIVIHYVGNPNSTAQANRNYFENLKTGMNNVYASSHYIIGLEGEIILCVPENEVAYHAGNINYNNAYIGIECCHPTVEGNFNSRTYTALIELCVDICKRYNLTEKNVIRHYDVTGKNCPLYYVKNPAEWEKLKNYIAEGLKGVEKEVVTKTKIMAFKNQNHGVWTEIEIDRILLDGTNYIKMKDLEKLGFKVEYDAKKNMPLINMNVQNN